MDSQIWLNIIDANVHQQFLIKRSKQITIISSLVLTLRTLLMVMNVGYNLLNHIDFIYSQWILRCLQLTVNTIMIVLNRRYPFKVTEIHGPIITLSLIPSIIFVFEPTNQSDNNFYIAISFIQFAIASMLLNAKWLITISSIFLSFLAFILTFTIYLKCLSPQTILLFAISVLLIMYCTHIQEKGDKELIVQIEKMNKINKDFENILSILPVGVVLYDDAKKKAIRINQEFKNLFGPLECDNELFNDTFNKKMFKQKNFQKDSEKYQRLLSINNHMLTFVQAVEISEEGQCFQKLQDESQSQECTVTFKKCEISFQDSQIILIMITDLTKIVKYEEMKLENHFYEMLTATVSHDMRTPLNAIIGLIQNLDFFVADDRGKTFLEIVNHSSRILLYLVNDLLDFFQIKNGKFRKNEKNVNIAESIKNLLKIFRVGAIEKGISINLEVDQQIPSILKVDEQRIQQVLINLVSNAFKFTIIGSIDVSMSYEPATEFLRFTVRDTGIGIQSEDKSKLFNLFGKLESTAQINTSGIGIGLSICQKIVQAFDGKIYLEESSGVTGSAFTFTIKCNSEEISKLNKNLQNDIIMQANYNPQICDENSQLNQTLDSFCIDSTRQIEPFKHNFSSHFLPLITKDTTRFQQKSMRQSDLCSCQERNEILITDDNIFNIVTLQTILEMQFNLRSDRAMNGQQAVEKVKQRICQGQLNPCICERQCNNYKIVFMDCNMPVMDGFEATREIRILAAANNFKIVIVALTAYTTDNFKTKCFDSGMDDYLTKPIAAPQLSAILKLYQLIPSS